MHLDRCHISRLHDSRFFGPRRASGIQNQPETTTTKVEHVAGQIQEVHWKNSVVLGIFPVFHLLSIVVTYYFLRHQTSPERFDFRAIQLVFRRQTLFFDSRCRADSLG